MVVKGYLWTPDGRIYQDHTLADHFTGINGITDFKDWIQHSTGNWSAILESDAWSIAAVDNVRSFPLFYTLSQSGEPVISDDAYALLEYCTAIDWDENSAAEMLVSAYVFGEDTLIKGIKQLLPGSLLLYDKLTNNASIDHYYRYRSEPSDDRGSEYLIEELDAILLRCINRALVSIEDRPIILALSGGYDSRLVLSLLKREGAKDIICYTYGMKGNPDSRISQKIANHQGYPWHFVEHDRRSHFQAFHSEERKNYYRYANHLSATAHIQDLLAVKELRQRGAIPENSVFMAGHSGDFMVGSYIPQAWKDRQKVKRQELLNELYRQQYSLWDWSHHRNTWQDIFDHKIMNYLDIPEDMDTFTAAALEEEWDWQERQPKFIINSTRVYEFFGYQWRIPLWDEELTSFWRSLPLKYRIDRVLYQLYANKHLPYPGLTVRGSIYTRALNKMLLKLHGNLYDARWGRFADARDPASYRKANISSVCDPDYRYPDFVNQGQRLLDTPINAIQSLVTLNEILNLIRSWSSIDKSAQIHA